MRRSSKDKNKTSPGPSGPGEVASGLVRILPKPVSQSSRHRIFSAIAADPCPKHPAGRRFPPPGGFRREPPVPDFAASHLAGSGFMMVWRDARANLLCVFPKFQDLFPSATASSPEGATCRRRGHSSDRANPFAFRPSSSRADRATPFAGYVHFWPIGVNLHLALSRVVTFSSFPGSQRGLCGRSRPPRRRLSINAIGSVLCILAVRFAARSRLPTGATRLAGYGIRHS